AQAPGCSASTASRASYQCREVPGRGLRCWVFMAGAALARAGAPPAGALRTGLPERAGGGLGGRPYRRRHPHPARKHCFAASTRRIGPLVLIPAINASTCCCRRRNSRATRIARGADTSRDRASRRAAAVATTTATRECPMRATPLRLPCSAGRQVPAGAPVRLRLPSDDQLALHHRGMAREAAEEGVVATGGQGLAGEGDLRHLPAADHLGMRDHPG